MLPLFQSFDMCKRDVIHHEIVESIANLLNEIPLENIHERFYAFCYLLWNGYLSIDKSYAYNDMVPLDEKNTIFLGRGCCRHNANLLAEVYKTMGISADSMSIRLIKTKLKTRLDIERKTEHSTEEDENNFKLYNHRVCVGLESKENNCVYLFDPTALITCEVIKNGKLFCFDGTYKIDKKLLKDDLKKISWYWYNHQYNKTTNLTSTKLKEFYQYAREVCEENKMLFNAFYDENHKHYEKIKSLILDTNNS